MLHRKSEGRACPPWEGKDAARRLIRGAAAGAIPRRSPPPRLLLCEASLTSSPGRVPPQGIVTQRPSARRTGVKRRPRRMRWEKERRGQRQRPGAVSEVVGKGVAPASTPLYGGPWGRRICRVATLRSARWPLLLRQTAENAVSRRLGERALGRGHLLRGLSVSQGYPLRSPYRARFLSPAVPSAAAHFRVAP